MSVAQSASNQAIDCSSVSELESSSVDVERIFNIGEKVVHPAHGVGIVQDIHSMVVSGCEQKFYQIMIIDSNMKVKVPVSQVTIVGLRKVIGSSIVPQIIDILKERIVVVNSQTWNRRYREYNQKLKTGSLFEIAKVVRDLSTLRSNKELSYGERTMLDLAKSRLVKEISIAVSRSEDVVLSEINSVCQMVPQ